MVKLEPDDEETKVVIKKEVPTPEPDEIMVKMTRHDPQLAKVPRKQKRRMWLEEAKEKKSFTKSLARQLKSELTRNKKVNHHNDLRLKLDGATFVLMKLTDQDKSGNTNKINLSQH